MDNILVFNPFQILFYCIGIIIPTITLLYTFGNFAFQLGEVRETHRELPMIIIMMLIRLFVITFGVIVIYQVAFFANVRELSLRMFNIILWGLLTIIDNSIINKELKALGDTYGNTKVLRSNVVKHLCLKIQLLYKHKKYLFILKSILLLIMIVVGIIDLFINRYLILPVLLGIYIYVNFRINNSINDSMINHKIKTI